MASTSSRKSAASAVLGSQTPRISRVPEYVSSAGQEAVELAHLAGLALDPWEELVLIDALGERADGKWAAFEVGVNVPRQNGKGTILEARELAGLFLLGERLLVHSAHEQLTSSEHFRRLLMLIESVPEFDRRVLKVVRGKGLEAIELRGGQRIFFKTRTGGGGRGLSGDFVALDEAMILPVATTAALVPLLAARSITGNPQLMYTGSAVDQEKTEHGIVFTRVRERALRGAARLMYVEFSAGVQDWLEAHGLTFDPKRSEIEQVTPAMLSDPGLWAQANPGLGIRISAEHIANERAGALGTREFAVERLGIGDPPDTDELAEWVIPEEAFEAAADADTRIAGVKTFGVDVNPDRTWGSITVAGPREDGDQHLEVVEHRRQTGWILGRCVELHEAHEGSRFVLDPRGPAAWLIQPLKDAGLTVIETSTQDYAIAFGGICDAFDQRRVHYPEPQPELADALASAQKASMGDGWKWSRKFSTGADVSPLVAGTLALWGSETQAPEPKRTPLVAFR